MIDSGTGISEEILPLIFEKFYCGSNSKGMGLGFAVVKAIVDIHKGKIEVKNRAKIGTEISLILPI